MLYTRRELGRLALASLPVAGGLKSNPAFGAVFFAKPDSKWAGVQVGMNVPYNFGMGNYMTGDEILSRCLQLGVSGVELRMQPVELFLGSPEAIAGAAPGRAGGGGRAAAPPADASAAPAGQAGARAAAPGAPAAEAGARQGGGRGRGPVTPEQEAAQKAAAEAQRKWRLSAPMAKVKEFRKKYEDAGVLIEIVKVDGIFNFSDDELDYAFTLANNLGARAISTEISRDIPQTKKVGQFADKHKMMVGYHGHTATGPAHWEEAFGYAKYNGANLDIGHFLAGNKISPIPFLKQHHDRITHIHVKDKTLDDKNVPFGQGDTPIKEALRAIRDNKWKIQATIEFEYPVPAGSDRMAEMAKCLQYCKDALLTS